MNTSESRHAQSRSSLGEPDNPKQLQLPTPDSSPSKAPTGRISYANSVTKNPFKSPINPLKTAITQNGPLFRSINPGAVVFDLSNIPTSDETIEDALEAIFDKFSPAAIRGYRQVGPQRNAIEIVFDPSVAPTHRKTATETGINIQNHQIKALPAQSMKTKLTFVKLRNMPLFPSEDAIVRVLSQSMAIFGKVKNVSIYKHTIGHGKYQSYNGEGFILLDTTASNESTYIELKPFVFIPEWQTTIQAKWDNAPPACTYCKQSGHVIRDCQIKLNSAMGIRTCYLCQQAGHTSRECPRKNGDFGTDSSQAIENNQNINNSTKNKKQKQIDSNTETTENTKKDIINNNHQSQESFDVEGLTTSQIQEIDVIQTDLSQKIPITNPNQNVALNDETDTEEEEDGDYCPEEDMMSTESEDSQTDDPNEQISDDEIQDMEYQKVMNYPSLPSSYDSIHAEAQRNYIYETRAQNSQATTSTANRNNMSIPDSQPSETDHDMMI